MHILMKANKFSYLADLIGTISLEAFDGRIEPFNELIHFIRPHKGQITTAAKEFLEGSEIIEQEKIHVGSVFISLHSTSSWR
jgi:histidine ammonia-lyase